MILIPTKGPEDWKKFLADPAMHWKAGYSAYSLAHSWENAKGFPSEIKMALEKEPILKDTRLLLAVPEYKVRPPGGGAASQNDLFCLGKCQDDLVTIMIEGKVDESFDNFVSEWYKNPSPGKVKHLEFLCQALGLDQDRVQGIRYQLLHRTVSAILEAQRFTASKAVMLVHSFSPTDRWLEDFTAFSALFGIEATIGKVDAAGSRDGVELFLGWVKGRV